jgi:hypothetical protein
MTLQEALTILTTFQLWRISDDEVHMQKPSEVTNALDVLLNHCVGTLELPQQETFGSKGSSSHIVYTNEIKKLIKQAHFDGQYLHSNSSILTKEMLDENAEYYSNEIIQSLKQPKKD